jgi:exopolysaccharide/PEP-CTERM locus tyrosine autokinase
LTSLDGESRPARTAVPAASKKKTFIEGAKHHVSQAGLIACGVLAPFDQAGPIGDDFRRIKRPLIANAVLRNVPEGDACANVVMLASAMPGSGKTFCAVNLAVSISLERELNVLLVDADVAKPHISRAFGLEAAPGLIDLLVQEDLKVADVLVRTDLNDIQILPAGSKHPQATELLASERMSRIVTELATRYRDRIVLLDSPPLLVTSEAQPLAGHVGQIAFVVEAGQTSDQMLAQALHALDSSKAINFILNKTRHHGRGYGGDYVNYGYERPA